MLPSGRAVSSPLNIKKPFDILALMNIPHEPKKHPGGAKNGDFKIWLGSWDSFRTLCLNPDPETEALFIRIRDMAMDP